MRTKVLVLLATLSIVALAAEATPPPFPRAHDPSNPPTPFPSTYVDARLEAAALNDCVAPFPPPGVVVPTQALVCGEYGAWADLNGDALVDANEFSPACPTGPISLVAGTGAWGPLGVVLDDGTVVTSGPIGLQVGSCDPATGHWHANLGMLFLTGNDPSYGGIVLSTTLCGAYGCATDTDVY